MILIKLMFTIFTSLGFAQTEACPSCELEKVTKKENLLNTICIDKDNGINLEKASAVVYGFAKQNCVGDKSQETCLGQSFKEQDACYNEREILEHYCENSVPKSKKMNCPTGTTCIVGACVKK